MGYSGEFLHLDATPDFRENTLAGRWRVATRDDVYLTPNRYREALKSFRLQYGLKEREPVWVFDGGWDVDAVPADPARPFTKALRVFETE
jgi:hypothetical protein